MKKGAFFSLKFGHNLDCYLTNETGDMQNLLITEKWDKIYQILAEKTAAS